MTEYNEETAVREELVSEEAAKAADYLAFIRHGDDEDALELVRNLLRSSVYARIFAAELGRHREFLKKTNDELAKL